MSWEKLGIQDPKIRWTGSHQDLHSNKLGDLFEQTADEIESYQDNIDDIMELGMWDNVICDFSEWLDYVAILVADAGGDPDDLRAKLVKARSELRKFKDMFDIFMITIEWH
jgi:hypothetical protein